MVLVGRMGQGQGHNANSCLPIGTGFSAVIEGGRPLVLGPVEGVVRVAVVAISITMPHYLEGETEGVSEVEESNSTFGGA